MEASGHRSSDVSLRPSQYDGEEEMEYEQEEADYEERAAEKSSTHALNLEWCIGFNFKLVNGVVNLIDDDRKKIFFVSGNTGVIYDFKEKDKKQTLLQGHCNEITCVAYCLEKDIIVTADRGPSSLMVVWNVKTGTPKHTIFDPHPNGIESLDITRDGATIVTLSLEEKEGAKRNIQTVKIWNCGPNDSNYLEVQSARIDKVIERLSYYDYQRYIHINKNKTPMEEFATTGLEKVYFWKVEASKGFALKGYQPTNNSINKRDKREKKEKPKKKTDTGKVGKDKKGKKEHDDDRNAGNQRTFTQTVFNPTNSQALTGTDDGHVVVWDISMILEENSDLEHRKENGLIPLIDSGGKKDKTKVGISVIISEKDMLVIGTTAGHVKFFDYQFLVLGWFESDKLTEVTSISFCNKSYDEDKIKHEADQRGHYFHSKDFIVVDKNAKIVEFKASKFNEIADNQDMTLKKLGETTSIEDEGSGSKTLILESIPGRVNSISSRPETSQIAISCENGSIYEWDFAKKEHQLTKVKAFQSSPGERPSCLQYSPNGEHLIVATNQRNVHCYKVKKKDWQKDPLTISQKKTVKGMYITFSENSEYFAIMDDQSCVSLYKLDSGGDCDWKFNGRLKSHMTDVNDVCFVEMLDQESNMKQMLYSIGEDKYLVEYDVKESRVDYLSYSPPFKIEQEIAPKACIWYPVNHLKEPVLLVATEDYKLKLWNVKTNSKKCVATFLGPTYGGPIKKMLYLKRKEEDSSKYVAYTTEEKIAGVIKLPLDGNPNKTVGMIVHPGRISSMAATSDGKFLFTSGYDDIGVVNMWYVNYAAIEEQEKIAEAGVNPLDIYPNLLEGGKDGQIYRDLKDFFYFAQINSNSDKPTKAKKLDGKIPYTEVPRMMKALGYYPTKQESQNMMDEVLYSKRHISDKLEDSLELDTFVKLFINHRPVYGLTTKLIKDKLDDLRRVQVDSKTNDSKEPQFAMKPYTREDFINDLTTRGEKFKYDELKNFINVLFKEGDPKTVLPESVDAEFLIEQLLGMEDENEEEPADFIPDHSN